MDGLFGLVWSEGVLGIRRRLGFVVVRVCVCKEFVGLVGVGLQVGVVVLVARVGEKEELAGAIGVVGKVRQV